MNKKYECDECLERHTFTGAYCDGCGWWRPNSYKRDMQEELSSLADSVAKKLVEIHRDHDLVTTKKQEKIVRQHIKEAFTVGADYPESMIDKIMEAISNP